jgi:hypothetical protein
LLHLIGLDFIYNASEKYEIQTVSIYLFSILIEIYSVPKSEKKKLAGKPQGSREPAGRFFRG